LVPAALGWELTSGDARWVIDERTGAIRGGNSVAGVGAVGRCRDVYEVVYTNRVAVESESKCRIQSASTNGLPAYLLLQCDLPELGLKIRKRYRIDKQTGWLMKQTVVVAPQLDKGFYHLISNVRVPEPMWNGGYLYHPIWNSGGSPLVATDDVTDERHFTSAEGTGMMMLSHPAHNVTIGHVRFANQGEPVFFDHKVGLWGTDKQKVPEVEERQTDTIAKPGQWGMSVHHGAVGNGVIDPISVEVAYAVMPGDFLDFHLAYQAIPEIRNLIHYESLSTPDWVRDHLLDVWTDYTLDPVVSGRAFAKLFERMWFGYVSMVVFGYYENSYSYPGDDEQWKTHLSTIRETKEHARSMEKRNKKLEDYVVRSGEGLMVSRCNWKPSEQRAAIRAIMESSGDSPRLKPAVYTHMGSPGQDRESPIATGHPELILTSASGQPYRHATDYNSDWGRPVGMILQGASKTMQDWWVGTLVRQLDFFDTRMTYFDTLARSSVPVDWKEHRAIQSRDMYPMYRRFVEESHDRDVALFSNYAAPMFSDLGYSEQAGYPTFRNNWRSYAARISGQQALNRRGRPLIVVSTPQSFELPFPPESLRAACVPYVLHAPLLHNTRMSLHPASRNDHERQARFVSRALPWYQAFFELRMRTYANPRVTPRWWANETELESHGYVLDKESGIVSFMNHEDATLYQEVSFRTAPLGMRAGAPAWVWRLQMPHPFEAEDVQPADDAPIPRLAKQRLVAYHEELPESLTYRESWPADTPVHLLVTHSPVLIRSVGGKRCQFFLPEAFGAKVGGRLDVKSGRLDLLATNHDDEIEILVPGVPGGLPDSAQMLRVGTMHEAGVLPAAEPANTVKVEIDGQEYLCISAPEGVAEFVLQ
jgi:hypothetical protein